MCKESALSISVIGEEGAYSKLLSCTDLCTTSILDALALLENQSGWWLICGARPAPGPRPKPPKALSAIKKCI
ncbi:MAG: hypothetical protein ACLR9Z_04150 [Alitiscatomonas sp.]